MAKHDSTKRVGDDDDQNDEVIGRALKYSLLGGLSIALTFGAVLLVRTYWPVEALPEKATVIVLPEERRITQQELPHIPFTEITQAAGIEWSHTNGMTGEKLLPETMGGGVAVFDYDRDGDVDLLFVGGKSWDWSTERVNHPRSLCLYQNQGDARFQDVTAAAGLDRELYGMAPAVGDYDNDGWDDLFISAVGHNLLLRNNQGRYEDVTQDSGVGGDANGWSTGATWFDYDNDGLLDLFVCDYVTWSRPLDLSLGFSLTGIGRAYGQPTSFSGTNSRLFHNQGAGIFRDVSQEMGIQVINPNINVPVGKGLCVIPLDINRDGWTDLMVANDTVQNFLFVNYEGREFIESAIVAGVAFDRSGNATGAMGMDCGNLRNDDSLAIAVGNFANEPSSLFLSRGLDSQFIDAALPTGIGPVSRLNLTFGMFFADLDLDSRQDIVCSNGHLEAEISKVQSTQEYRQPPQYFWNAGPAGDTELVALGEKQVGADAIKPMVGRGAAYGDLDQDGDIDVVLVENGGQPRILRNDQQLGHHWLRIQLEGSPAINRNAYGAVVTLKTGQLTQRRYVTPTRSYLSQCETTLTFGLGEQSQVDELTIVWPDGSRQRLDTPAIDQLHKIVQAGVPAAP